MFEGECSHRRCVSPDFRPDTLQETAAAAERAGVAELWLWEDCFLQGGIAQAAVALVSSERSWSGSVCCLHRCATW